MEDLEEKDDSINESVNELMNDGGYFRKALATPGLLIVYRGVCKTAPAMRGLLTTTTHTTVAKITIAGISVSRKA